MQVLFRKSDDVISVFFRHVSQAIGVGVRSIVTFQTNLMSEEAKRFRYQAFGSKLVYLSEQLSFGIGFLLYATSLNGPPAHCDCSFERPDPTATQSFQKIFRNRGRNTFLDALVGRSMWIKS